jgi:homoserine kinase type II
VETQEALVRVLACYDVGQFKAAHRIERGFVNENWIVETTQGRYFLKRRPPHLRQPDAPAVALAVAIAVIRAQHALMARLRERDFPAPAVAPTIHGETLHVAGDEFYEVHEYIEGEPYDHGRPAHLAEAAVTLGRYHTCVQGFAPRALRDLGELYTPAILKANLSKLSEAWSLQPPASDFQPPTSNLQQLEAHVADLAARFAQAPALGSLPHLVIHGDYYAGNLLFEGDRIAGVVDYDHARLQARVVELAEALIYFASPRPGHLKHLVYPGFLQWEPFTRFLRHYARVVTLEENEVRALPDYVRCIWLAISLQRLWEKGARPAWGTQALQEVLALGDWARANAQRMSESAREPAVSSRTDR